MTRTDSVQRGLDLHQQVDAARLGRIEFVAYLRQYVADMRKRLMDENRATRAAWFGPTRAEQATIARIKAEEVAETARVAEAAEAADAARIKAAETARAAEAAEAADTARIKAAEAARAAEAAQAADAARIKAAEASPVAEVVETDRINAATNQARKAVSSITEALKDALTRSNKKLNLSKAINKSNKEKRGH